MGSNGRVPLGEVFDRCGLDEAGFATDVALTMSPSAKHATGLAKCTLQVAALSLAWACIHLEWCACTYKTFAECPLTTEILAI